VFDVQDTSNIVKGDVSFDKDLENELADGNVYPTAAYAISIDNQTDLSGGQLFNTIWYVLDGDEVAIVSKSLDTYFSVFLPDNTTDVIVDTYDLRGAMTRTWVSLLKVDPIIDIPDDCSTNSAMSNCSTNSNNTAYSTDIS
jgi:hypothetical protein